VVSKIHDYLAGDDPGAPEVERALQAAMAAGALTDNDLEALVALRQESGDVTNTVGSISVKGNAYMGNTFNIKGPFRG
jgi:hypothetical protein